TMTPDDNLYGETTEKEAMLSIEKLRKIVANLRWSAKDGAEQGATALFSAGLAEAVVRTEFDPIDVVTEVINRVEHALGQAMSQGLARVVAFRPTVLAARPVA